MTETTCANEANELHSLELLDFQDALMRFTVCKKSACKLRTTQYLELHFCLLFPQNRINAQFQKTLTANNFSTFLFL